MHACQLSIVQYCTFWVEKMDYLNQIDLGSAVQEFHVRERGHVLSKIGRDTLKGSSDPSHFIFECRKEADPTSPIVIPSHRTTPNLNGVIFMSEPTLSNIDFKNKMAESPLN